MFLKFILSIIVIFFNLYVIRYMNMLRQKECECYEDKKTQVLYIFGYSILTIAVVSIYYLIPIMINFITKKTPSIFTYLVSGKIYLLFELYLMGGLVNLVLIYTLTKQIIESKCNCSDTLERKVLKYYSSSMLIIYILSFILSIDMYIS